MAFGTFISYHFALFLNHAKTLFSNEPEGYFILIINDLLPVPPEFVALSVTVVLPAADGVPVILPLVPFSVNPAGNVPTTE
jgi:hypothetical protein